MQNFQKNSQGAKCARRDVNLNVSFNFVNLEITKLIVLTLFHFIITPFLKLTCFIADIPH